MSEDKPTKPDVLAYLENANAQELKEFLEVIERRLNLPLGMIVNLPTAETIIARASPEERERIKKKFFT